MARCIWDDVPTGMGWYVERNYPNFAALAKQLPCAGNPEQQAIADKLKSHASDTTFLGKLNDALADPAVRDRIVKIYNEEPAALNAAVDKILEHPEQTADIVRGIQLKSEQPAQPPPQEQPKTPPKTETPSKPPVTTKPENTPPHPAAAGEHHIENADNARLQAQMHVMGVYKGDINGSDRDTNAALKEYASHHPELNIKVTDKDLSADQLKAVKDAVASDFDKWSHDKTNAQHLKDTIKAGYDVGALKPASDSVKEMQIAALALGGTLPRFGVDGIRGRETNKALRDIMAPEGQLTKILDAAGIEHEWKSEKPEDKTSKTAPTSAAVRNGETSVITTNFNGRAGGNIDPGIVYQPPRRPAQTFDV